MGEVLSRRNMRWDMSFLYPGLQMHLTPSVNPGGVLEFALDPQREVLNQHSLKEASTGENSVRETLNLVNTQLQVSVPCDNGLRPRLFAEVAL